MASILSVEQLRGLSSGDTPNTITLPTGQTLDFSAGTLTMPAGHVIQVVSSVPVVGTQGTTSTSFVTTTISGTITPSSASSKILVLIQSSFSTESANRQQYVTIYRDSTNLGDSSTGFGQNVSSGAILRAGLSLHYLDSPNTTSSVTYYLAHRSVDGQRVEIEPISSVLSNVTLMEISG